MALADQLKTEFDKPFEKNNDEVLESDVVSINSSIKSSKVLEPSPNKTFGGFASFNSLTLKLRKSVRYTKKNLSNKGANLSSTDSEQNLLDNSCSVSEIEENVPDYEPKTLPQGERIGDEEQMRRTEKKLKQICSLRNDKENRKVKENLRNLYKEMTGTMVSYVNEQDSIAESRRLSSLAVSQPQDEQILNGLYQKLEKRKQKLQEEEESSAFLLEKVLPNLGIHPETSKKETKA